VSRRLPAEFEAHERTVMCWPTRASLYADLMDEARRAHALVADTVAAHEPVTMIAAPGGDADDAAARCSSAVEILEMDLDDSWFRDTGPIYVFETPTGPAGPVGPVELLATDWVFNGWGNKFTPFDADASLAGRFATAAGHRVEAVDMVLEGGSITTDGRGTVVTTAQCLMHPNRNPSLSRSDIEGHLSRHLGAQRVVWLPFGLIDDGDTDGHVDNVAAFADPSTILVQGCDDPDIADHHRLDINRRWIDGVESATGDPVQVVEIPVLPFAEIGGRRVAVPYLNFYVGNGFVVVPVCGHGADDDMVALIGEQFADREIIALEVGAVLAYGGGGIHCITQQIPAVT
jgi:agmatine deiminase